MLFMSMWGEYVLVSVRHTRAKKEMEKLQKKGQKIEPIEISGRKITQKFWGKKWCDHLENFADYENRLPRGRSYVRNGSICHLTIQKGSCEAIVSGSELYKVSVTIKTLAKDKWEAIKRRCSGQIGSILEFLQGKISHHVMEVVADQKEGLFPDTKEMRFECNCPDWADMCKHVAAVLYGLGNRLDHQPELLFLLRGVDPNELVSAQLSIETQTKVDQLESGDLGEIFGIEIENTLNNQSSQNELLKKTPKKSKKINKSKQESNKIFDLDVLTGEKLRALRTEKGYSVNTFAEALDVTSASIYRWEKNLNILNLQLRTKNALKDFLQK